jgi:hypothetical protein
LGFTNWDLGFHEDINKLSLTVIENIKIDFKNSININYIIVKLSGVEVYWK